MTASDEYKPNSDPSCSQLFIPQCWWERLRRTIFARRKSPDWIQNPLHAFSPCYVTGWDRSEREWRECVYYAGAAQNLWRPYTIGFLESEGRRGGD